MYAEKMGFEKAFILQRYFKTESEISLEIK